MQNHSMDILDLDINTLEPLDVRRDNHTVKAFNEILDLKDHPCKRFINESTNSYRLRSQRVCVPAPLSNKNWDSFIQRGARLHST